MNDEKVMTALALLTRSQTDFAEMLGGADYRFDNQIALATTGITMKVAVHLVHLFNHFGVRVVSREVRWKCLKRRTVCWWLMVEGLKEEGKNGLRGDVQGGGMGRERDDDDDGWKRRFGGREGKG